MNILFSINDLVDKVNEAFEPLKDLIMKNHGNPVFWIIMFALGIGTFFMTYGALHGNND